MLTNLLKIPIFRSPKEEALWRVYYRGESFDHEFLTTLAREARMADWSRLLLMWVVPVVILGSLALFLVVQEISYQRFVSEGVPLEALLVEKLPGRWSKSQLVYEYDFAGRAYRGTSRVPEDVFEQFEIGDPVPVLVLEQKPARSMSEWAIGPPADPWPYYGGVAFLTLAWLIYLERERSENRYDRLGIRLVLAMGGREDEPAVRAILEKYHRQGGREDFPATAEHWCTPLLTPRHGLRASLRQSSALIRWADRQPQPPEMDRFLARAGLALHWLSGYRRPLPPLDARRPSRIRLTKHHPREEPLLRQCPNSGVLQLISALVGLRVFEFPTEGMDSITLDLRGFHWTQTLEQMAQAETIRFQVFSQHGSEGALEDEYRRRLRNKGLDTLHRQEVAPLSTSAHGGPNVEWTRLYPIEALDFVNATLYFFYLCPWRWKSVEQCFEIQTPDKRQVFLRLEFEPDRQLRICRLS